MKTRTLRLAAPPPTRLEPPRPVAALAACWLALALVLPGVTALGQIEYHGVISPPGGGPGSIVDISGLIPFDQAYFAFEVEGALESLKDVPTWDEIEKMLDNPYAIARDTEITGSYPYLVSPFSPANNYYYQGLPLSYNYQGWPGYRSTTPRRRSYIYRNAAGEPCAPGTPGCNNVPLPPFLVHPLNYNHMNGEELRLLNIDFEETEWTVPDTLVATGTTDINPRTGAPVDVLEWTYRTITVSAGIDRVEDDEASPDFNSPIAPQTVTTDVFTVEPTINPPGTVVNPPGTISEGQRTDGADPGEPGYAGFGFLRPVARRGEQYSTPAVVMNTLPAAQRVPGRDITTGPIPLGTGTLRLFDPAREFPEANAGHFILPRNAAGQFGLRKPSLGVAIAGGTPANPNFLANSADELAEAAAEADAEEPDEAPHDPEVFLLPSNENDYIRRPGSVLAAIPTGRDAAVALGKALFWDMQVGSDSVQSCGTCHFHAGADNRTKNQVNPNHLGGDLTFQVKQPNQELTATDFPFHRLVNPDGRGDDPANVTGDINDVASSMGVFFRQFVDIPPIGAAGFTPASAGVASVLPDIGAIVPDPIPGFNGLNGLPAFRRVEPRNTPTLFGASLNFDNFWDGRARHDFNGGSVFGASDPQAHVFIADGGDLIATRQMIRFSSLSSLGTGPALSDFEMSWSGRNWAKIAKKLCQAVAVPLANQLVDPMDSVLGPFSNQPGNPAPLGTAAQLAARAPGKPGLCVTYPQLIRAAFHPRLWSSVGRHLNGGYTDGRLPAAVDPEPIPILADADGDGNGDTLNEINTDDPFDHYVLTIADGPAAAANPDQFSQLEANFSLFFGLSINAWGNILIPDDTPMDRFYDANPSAFISFGESNEKYLVPDLVNCADNGNVEPCFHEVGNFKRDPDVTAVLYCLTENCDNPERQDVPAGGTRAPSDPDPLFGMDLFLGSNLSLKNPLYRSFRCGECHASGTLTDHTVSISHQWEFNDWVPEFGEPGREVFPEPLGRGRVITGFSLEGENQENAQDGIERNIADFALDELGAPQGQALFDNGVYNIGVTPIGNDISRGGNDAFGWPLALTALAFKNLAGLDYTPGGHLAADGFALPAAPGIPLPNFDPAVDEQSGGLFEPTAQDQQINPGFGEEPAEPLLPPYLAKWASNVNVGDETQQDELFIGLNTLCAEPILEGFVDSFGPFNPAATVSENFNSARQPAMATWPVVNRANRMGSFKAPPLRNIELTGPYFHNGGNLTLRQQLDFYLRGGNFPVVNSSHRDFLIANLNIEDEALGGIDPILLTPAFTAEQKEHAKNSLIDFLLELTDERVRYERAPFDHPEIFVPLDGRAPNNTFGRTGLLALSQANGNVLQMYRQVPAVGQGGNATPLPNFLGISSTPVPGPNNDHYDR